MNKLKMMLLSGSAVLLLAACGNETNQPAEDTTQNGTDQGTEQPADTGSQENTGDDTGGDDTQDPADTNQGQDQGVQNQDFDVALMDAVDLFFETFPEAEGIDLVEFDVDDGRFEYEIDGFNATTEFELTIDAETGEILEERSENESDDNEAAIDFDEIILPSEAFDLALTEIGSGYVHEWSLESDDGRTHYELDIRDADRNLDDVLVDALSGDVRFDD